MILVDTTIWIDHLRHGDAWLSGLLEHGEVLIHPFVIGELALGNLSQRQLVLSALGELPRAAAATDAEVLHMIESAGLHGLGIGYVDAHLLASARLSPDAMIWTRDKRFAEAVRVCGLEAPLG